MVGRSVVLSHSAVLAIIGGFGHHCSFPNAWFAYFITTPTHLQATLVAAYPVKIG
ncbi:MAG: hypothetical protein VX313_06825 [Bacteroidota bacterium]|nr:hypothetical protein [Bacteroidota bacterium]